MFVANHKETEWLRLAHELVFYRYASMNQSSTGHVRAYKRTNRVSNHFSDACGPAYITVGEVGSVGRMTSFLETTAGACPKLRTTHVASQFNGNCVTYQPADNGSFCPSQQDGYKVTADVYKSQRG